MFLSAEFMFLTGLLKIMKIYFIFRGKLAFSATGNNCQLFIPQLRNADIMKSKFKRIAVQYLKIFKG